jgi:hypothetical protein
VAQAPGLHTGQIIAGGGAWQDRSRLTTMSNMSDQSRFIGEEIEVAFDKPPILEKKPGPPDRFIWQSQKFEIVQVLAEWHDYRRRGRMAMNMSPAHATVAEQRGSWGVGRDYFRVRTAGGRLFELYYDRAPKDVDRRKGAWFLFRELAPDEADEPSGGCPDDSMG